MYICKWSVSRSDKAKNQIIFFNILRARLGASLNDNFSIEYILPSFALEIYIIDIIWLIFISPRCGVYKSYLWKRPFFPPLWHPTQLRFFKFTWEKRANFRRKRFKICTITYFWRNLARVCRASGIGFPASRALSITGSKSTNRDLNRVWDICSKVWFMDESVVILSSKALRLLTIKSWTFSEGADISTFARSLMVIWLWAEPLSRYRKLLCRNR